MSTIARSVAAVTVTDRSPGTEMAAGDVAEYQLDCTNTLGAEQVPISPSVELVDTRSGTAVVDGAALDTVPIQGKTIIVRVANVQRNGKYELRISFLHSPPRVAGERSTLIHAITGG